jgi:hypothetical protein
MNGHQRGGVGRPERDRGGITEEIISHAPIPLFENFENNIKRKFQKVVQFQNIYRSKYIFSSIVQTCMTEF